MPAHDDEDETQSYLSMYRPNHVSSLQARAQNVREQRAARTSGAAKPTPRPSQRNASPSAPNNRRTSNVTGANTLRNQGNRRVSASTTVPPPPPPVEHAQQQGEQQHVYHQPPPIILDKNTPRTVYYYMCEHTETKIGEGKAGPNPLKMLKKRPCDACLRMHQQNAQKKMAQKKAIGRGRDGRLGIVREKR